MDQVVPWSIAGTKKVCARSSESRNVSVTLAFLLSILWNFDAVSVSLCFFVWIHSVIVPWFFAPFSRPWKFDAVRFCFLVWIHSVLLPWLLVPFPRPAASEHLRFPANLSGLWLQLYRQFMSPDYFFHRLTLTLLMWALWVRLNVMYCFEQFWHGWLK